ncbi:MAG: hypothetical protein ACI9XP_001624 [Lentimonas sp.]|jgi:hypothetical protein
MLKFYLSFALIFIAQFVSAQQLLSGKILDETFQPIPFAKVYVKNDAEKRTIADVNGYFEMRLLPGEYYVVVMSTGYDQKEAYVGMSDNPIELEIQVLPTKIQDIADIEVSTKKSNPGRDIMLKVVERRDTLSQWEYAHKVEVYTRATEKKIREEKSDREKEKEEEKRKKEQEKADEENLDPTGADDPFAEKRKVDDAISRNMNLVEIQLTRNYAPPSKVKEIRNAYDKKGSDRNLYYTTTVKSNFNFFQNLIHLDDLHQTPITSPVSGVGILSYKYRLVEQYEENGQKIHKIKIIPRGSATTTLSGHIYVIDSIWMIQKLELTLEKGNLLMYDYFTIEQEYKNQGDSLNILTEQKLIYGVKYKDYESDCITLTEYSDYNFSPGFAPKFFNNELSITEKAAYEKDTSYWQQKRAVVLTDDERKYIAVKDSIESAHNKKEYLDSVDAIFNKVTALKVLWWGIDHRNRDKKVQWSINSLAAFARPLYIAGPRLAPGFSYFKKWDNERFIDTYAEVTYGLLNKDVKGNMWTNFRYDPFHFGNIGVVLSHDFDVIRSFDAITQIYKRSNFIETTKIRVNHFREYINGLYLSTDVDFSERRDVNKYKFVELLDNTIPNEAPTVFDSYQAMVIDMTLSYVPGQKYMREPNRKVLLGSKWPTFYATYEVGVPKIFGSDINHEYGLLGMRQTFKIGTLGTTNYHIKAGKFLSSKALYDADFKYHRRSDPFWFSNPLYTFQDLDSSLPSKDIFYEAHFVHHDNGAILNKIPFMKKTGIGLVVGGGALYVKEFDWQHYEILAGLERNFKFSRRKLRIGVYGVLSDGNRIDPQTTWKISFAILDLRNMKWNF